MISSNPPKGHGLEDIYRHQAQAFARIERWTAVEDDALARMERARTTRTREKWRQALIHAQRNRVRAEQDFAKYEREELRTITKRERRRRRPPPPPPLPPKQYEYVLKVDYDADPRTGHGRRQTFFDIRLRKASGFRASDAELRSLSAGLKMGEIPEGWEFREIVWGRGRREDAPEGIPPRGPGDETDFQNLSPMISQRLRPTEIGEEEV